MVNEKRLDIVYAEQLKDHPEGHALYKKFSAHKIAPGICGYFDSDGDWHHILDLKNRAQVLANGCQPLLDPESLKVDTETGTITFGPKHSLHVKGVDVGVKAKASDPVGIAGGAVELGYKSSAGAGAVLITEPPIKRQMVEHETVILDWVAENAAKLLSNKKFGPAIQKYGVWIITKTYSAKRCALAVLSSEEQEVRVSFSVQTQGAELTPTANWWNRGSDSSWLIHADSLGVVVFMNGIEFRPRKFKKSELKSITDKDKQKPLTRAGGGLKEVELRPIILSEEDADENADDVFGMTPIVIGSTNDEMQAVSHDDN